MFSRTPLFHCESSVQRSGGGPRSNSMRLKVGALAHLNLFRLAPIVIYTFGSRPLPWHLAVEDHKNIERHISSFPGKIWVT